MGHNIYTLSFSWLVDCTELSQLGWWHALALKIVAPKNVDMCNFLLHVLVDVNIYGMAFSQ